MLSVMIHRFLRSIYGDNLFRFVVASSTLVLPFSFQGRRAVYVRGHYVAFVLYLLVAILYFIGRNKYERVCR